MPFRVASYAWLVGALVVPIFVLVRAAVSGPFTPLDWIEVRAILQFTIVEAALSAALSCVLGLGLAWAWSEHRALRWPSALSFSGVCFVLPSVWVALSIVRFWGRAGWAGQWIRKLGWDYGGPYGWPGILLGHCILNVPLAFLLLAQALALRSRTQEHAALSLGMKPLNVFFSFALRSVQSEVRVAFILIFLYCASSFAIVMILGGSPTFTNVEVAQYQAIRGDLDATRALELGTLSLGIAFLAQWILPSRAGRGWFSKIGPLESAISALGARSSVGRSLVSIGVAFVLIFLFAPVASVLFTFLHGYSLSMCVLAQSIGLAWITAAFTLVISLVWVLAGSDRKISRMALAISGLPLAVSGMFLSAGFWLAYRPLVAGSFNVFAIVAAQSFLFFPFAFRWTHERYYAMPSRYPAVAASLGAGQWERWRFLHLPWLMPSLKLAFAYLMALSLGESGMVLALSNGRFETLSSSIFRSMARYHFDEAVAAGNVLLLLVVVILWLGKKATRE